eukprot:4135659-Pyramimonas_sp.AAC.1
MDFLKLRAYFLDRRWAPLGGASGAAPGALRAPGRGPTADPRNPRGPSKVSVHAAFPSSTPGSPVPARVSQKASNANEDPPLSSCSFAC